jgi:hypothetical protein
MTRTISLIIGIATVALFVAVPTALGEGRIGSLQADPAVVYFDANERTTILNSSTQPALGAYTDAHEHGTVQPIGSESVLGAYVDANERVGSTTTLPSEPSSYRDGGERGTLPTGPATVATVAATGSGSEIDWPQIGIGFGVGIALALGLLVAMRFTRIRPLAH